MTPTSAPVPTPTPVDPIELADLASAIALGRRELVSLVGGGGKTTLLFALGRLAGARTILTTTTKMGRDQTGGFPVLDGPTDAELGAALDRDETVLVRRGADGTKAIGVDGSTCDRWFDPTSGPAVDRVIVEADGSRQRPFKAPRAFEPVIPSTSTLLIACVGAGALGRVIADACHRPLRLAAIAGCSPYQRLTPDRLATVLASDRGSRKECPDRARYVVVINQVTDSHLPFVSELAGIIGSAFPVLAVSADHDLGRR